MPDRAAVEEQKPEVLVDEVEGSRGGREGIMGGREISRGGSKRETPPDASESCR